MCVQWLICDSLLCGYGLTWCRRIVDCDVLLVDA